MGEYNPKRLAQEARAFWGNGAVKGCREWAKGAQTEESRKEWAAAADILEHEGRKSATVGQVDTVNGC